MPTVREEFEKFVADKLSERIPIDAYDDGFSYDFLNRPNADMWKQLDLAIDPKNKEQEEARSYLADIYPDVIKAIENFERYDAQQKNAARATKLLADDLVQKLKAKVTENTGSVLGYLFSSHKAKLDNKSRIINNIINEVEHLGYTDYKTYKERFVKILSDYLEKNKTNKEGPILGSDTKAKLEGIVSKLNPAPAPTANKNKLG
jgi:hypothetical protein